MLVAKIIVNVSMLIWVLTPVRQYGGRYFLFFLISALLDPMIMLMHFFIHVVFFRIYSVADFIMLITIIDFKKVVQFKYYIIALLAITIYLADNLTMTEIPWVIVIENIVTLYLFLKITLLYIDKRKEINIFHVVMDLYLFTLAIKFIAWVIDIRFGVLYFYITTAFEILIGIFFIFYNDNNSPKLKLRHAADLE